MWSSRVNSGGTGEGDAAGVCDVVDRSVEDVAAAGKSGWPVSMSASKSGQTTATA